MSKHPTVPPFFLSFPLPFQRSSDSNSPYYLWLDDLYRSSDLGEPRPSSSLCCESFKLFRIPNTHKAIIAYQARLNILVNVTATLCFNRNKWWHLSSYFDPSHSSRIRSPKSRGVKSGPLCNVLKNVAGFARLDAYIQSRNRIAALGYVYTLGKQTSCSPERCTSRNAMSVEFLEVQIPPCILVYDWDP